MFCTDEYSIELFQSLSFLVFSPNAPALLYYSHVPAAIIAVLLSLFILSRNKTLEAKILVATSLLYSAWAVINLFIWTQIDTRIVMYLWSFWFTIFALIFVLSFYFLYVFIRKSDVDFRIKLLFFALVLPIIVLSSTSLNLSYFDIGGCNALENPFMLGYSYLLTTIVFLSMVIFAFNEYYRAQIENKKQIALVSLGILLFLISFMVATYIPSILNLFESSTDTFAMEMYGFFGMTIFIGFLTYLIVKYKAFNIKLIAAQALVLALVALIASEFFFVTSDVNRILVSITLFLAIMFGFFLVRSVKREIKQREELAIANEGQATLIHFINHQIKGYLNKAKIVFTEVLTEPEYGPLTEPAKNMLTEGESFMVEGVDFVQQILRASDIEKGTFKYDMKLVDLKSIVGEIANESRKEAEGKGLKYDVVLSDAEFKITGDQGQLKEAIKNLITNSILYTPNGSISIKLEKGKGKALFMVKDTGVGLSDEVKPKLFTKGGRSVDSLKINVNSTGYGLAIVKGVVEAHKGRVWAESAGVGKGSTFYMELPLAA